MKNRTEIVYRNVHTFNPYNVDKKIIPITECVRLDKILFVCTCSIDSASGSGRTSPGSSLGLMVPRSRTMSEM